MGLPQSLGSPLGGIHGLLRDFPSELLLWVLSLWGDGRLRRHVPCLHSWPPRSGCP